ncbi:MAG: hypothetical protein GY869_22430 [Planctomycetes bacterium]|nr:hypothetical protein [Planctomycetota bacterium]
MKQTITWTTILVLALYSGVFAQGIGTAFTYQGKLSDGGNPAQGEFDFKFILYNSLTAGSTVGNLIPKENLLVTAGMFTVELDFGTGVFDGSQRWLQISVKPSSSTGAFSTLDPRQPIHAAPYALYALNTTSTPTFWQDNGINIFNTNSGSVGIGVSNPLADLHVVGTPDIGSFLLAPNNTGSGFDSELWLAENRDNRYGMSLKYDGLENRLQVFGKSDALINGPHLVVNRDDGKVGIGATVPDEMLHIENPNDGATAFIKIEASHPTNFHEAGLRITTPQNTWHFRMDDDTNNQIPNGAIGLRSQDTNSEVMTWTKDANVGIGQTNPTEKLEVAGSIKADNLIYTNPRTQYLTLSGPDFIAYSNIEYYITGYGTYLSSGHNPMMASLHLPHGANLKEFTAFFNDNSTSDITVRLMRSTLTSGTLGNLGSIDSSGVTGYGSDVKTYSSFIINNIDYAYYFDIRSTAWDGSDLRIKGIRIKYTMTEPF